MDRILSNYQKCTYRLKNKSQGEVTKLLYPSSGSKLYTTISAEKVEKMIINSLTNLKLKRMQSVNIPDEFKECLRDTIEKYRKDKKILKSQIRKDFLTGIYNKGYLSDYLKRKFDEINRKAENEPISCIMFDIDFFKNVNDTYGHEAGDIVLKNIAQIMVSNCRSSDIVARYGGEEFIIVCPNTDLEGAYILAEKIRKLVESASFQINNAAIKCTISSGVTCYQSNEKDINSIDSPKDLIKKSDECLYEAKRSGRNKVVAK